MLKDMLKINNTKRFLAFTLAETLIVMGIIGIVSALTLPNLNSSTGEKEKVAKVKKIYQNLDDAIGRATAVYGPVNEWFANDSTNEQINERFMSRITEFMKVSKVCSTPSDCIKLPSPYNETSNAVILADGTVVGIPKSIAINSAEGWIAIDIDGPQKGSGTGGKDIFVFNYDSQNALLYPRGQNDADSGFSDCTTELQVGCAYWVIAYDNMDYLKAGSNGKCNNSSATLNAKASPPVTSCK